MPRWRNRHPALLKVARFGYDGKGQARVDTRDEARAAFARIRRRSPACWKASSSSNARYRWCWHAATPANARCSRSPKTATKTASSTSPSCPPACPTAWRSRRARWRARVADKLGYCGVMAVEFFVAGGRLLINEIAPRPHNSGHYTLDACVTTSSSSRCACLRPAAGRHAAAVAGGDGQYPGRPLARRRSRDWDAVLRAPRAQAAPVRQGSRAAGTQDGPLQRARRRSGQPHCNSPSRCAMRFSASVRVGV